MSDLELLERFKKEYGPITLAQPSSRPHLHTHLFCSDGIHLPRFNRLWEEPICGDRTLLPHCNPQPEDWPSCEHCQRMLHRLLVKVSRLPKGT